MRCDHCLLEVAERDAVRAELGGAPRVFCCAGCRAVYQLVTAEGLGQFYAGRRWDEPGLVGDPERPVDAAAFRDAVRAVEGGDAEIDVTIEGIRCASCVWLNERLLQRLPGVRAARVNFATHRARVRWDPGVTSLEAVLGRIRAAGYEPRPWAPSERQRALDAEVRDLLLRLGTAFFLSSQLMIYSAALYAGYFQGMEPRWRRLMEGVALALTLPIYLYAGAPFLRGARRLGMDALIALGAGAALAYSVWQMARGGEVYFDTAAMIVTLVLAGRYVEARARRGASEAIARLGRLLPRDAQVVGKGRVALEAIAAGDLVEVAPGERIALDGEVVEGASEVDEALVTGEARPVAKAPGAAVIGGTLNLAGAFTFRVTRIGDRTVLAGIARAIEDAQARKPRIQAVADRVTGWFVPAVLALAAGTVALHLARGAALSHALMTGVSVVVIACPCSLGLATPIAVLLATGAASARGLLVKGADVLERAAGVTEVVLDKTGTLTLGRPVLREVVLIDRGVAATRDVALALAAAVERRSEHGLARAIHDAARALPAPPPEAQAFQALPGRGVAGSVAGIRVLVGNRALLADEGVRVPEAAVAAAAPFEAEGDTVVYLGAGRHLAALLVITDVLRDEARGAIAELRALGLGVSIVSGDAAATTAAVAARAGVAQARAEVTPAGKAEAIGDGALVVGDGINDAPALARAAVGVALRHGTDVTLESADAVLVREDLRLVPALVRLGRRTRRVIRQNVFWAFFYNVTAIPLAVAGVLHPIVAAAAMASSSLFVVGNSLRVRKWT